MPPSMTMLLHFLIHTLLFSSFPTKAQNPPQKHPLQASPGTEAQTKSNDNSNLDPVTQAKIKYNINPEWSPDPDNAAPLSLDYPLSPWNDGGRSMVDDSLHVSWEVCGEVFLNCKKCPGDFRCLLPLPSSSSSSSPSATSSSSTGFPSATSAGTNLDEEAVPTPPWPSPTSQLSSSPSTPILNGSHPANVTGISDTHSATSDLPRCPLQHCGPTNPCGASARCESSFCTCNKGMKGLGRAFRGGVWPKSLTVHVDPGVACNVRCKRAFCSEVRRENRCLFGFGGWNGTEVFGLRRGDRREGWEKRDHNEIS